ncbi:MAG: hypothetical protein LH617_12065, partial [Ramlibacter sp.]|nr:hypothetical protein [Ramlibacter sp.]
MNQPAPPSQRLLALAERSGVASRYHSFYGEDKAVSEVVLVQALRAIGVDPDQADEAGDPQRHDSFLPASLV